MPDRLPNLPGVRFTIRDRTLIPITTTEASPRLLIIGTAVDGPTNVPVRVDSLGALEAVFGPTRKTYGHQSGPGLRYTSRSQEDKGKAEFNGNTLVLKAREAWDAGVRDIIVVRTKKFSSTTLTEANAVDKYATLTLANYDVDGVGLLLRSLYEGPVYNAQNPVSGAYSSVSALSADTTGRLGVWIQVDIDGWVDSVSLAATVSSGATSFTVAAADAVNFYPNMPLVIEEAGATATYARVTDVVSGAVNYTVYIDKGVADDYTTSGTVTTGLFKIFKPAVKGGEVIQIAFAAALDACTGGYTVGTTYGELIYDINNHPNNNVVLAELPTSATNDTVVDLSEVVPMGGAAVDATTKMGDESLEYGATGLNLAGATNNVAGAYGCVATPEYYIENTAEYTLTDAELAAIDYGLGTMDTESSTLYEIQGLYADYCIFADCFADAATGAGVSKEFIPKLAEFCWLTTENAGPMSGVIGVQPLYNPTNIASVKKRVDDLTLVGSAMANLMADGFFSSDGADTVDIGAHVIVVAGPDVIISGAGIGRHVSDGAVQVAATLIGTPISKPPINSGLRGGSGLSYKFNHLQLDKLVGGQHQGGNGALRSGGAYLALTTDNTGIRIIDGPTAARRASDYSTIHNMRVMKEVARRLRGSLNGYIGQAYSIEIEKAMDMQIIAIMEGLAEEQIIFGTRGSGYDFAITAGQNALILGEIYINMEIRPSFQIKKIHFNLRLSGNLTV